MSDIGRFLRFLDWCCCQRHCGSKDRELRPAFGSATQTGREITGPGFPITANYSELVLPFALVADYTILVGFT